VTPRAHRLLDALDGIMRAAKEHGVNDEVGAAIAVADKLVARLRLPTTDRRPQEEALDDRSAR
jgi:hypothetical protein